MAGNSAVGPVQARVFAILSGDSALTALVGSKVYDHVPENTPMPYVVLAQVTERPDDTLGTKGRIMMVTVEVFSQAEGYKEVEAITEEVVRLLDNDHITGVVGWTVASSIYHDGSLMREADGITRHASLSFELEATA